MQKKGNKYGTHRVIEPKGVLTQAAQKIDNNMDEIYSNEILCNVTALNIDSASFTQISDACGGDETKIGEMIIGIVAERGKQQNPVTGSGGMFMGNVAKIGDDLKGKIDLKEGDKMIGVALPVGETRDMLNIVDNPSVAGKTIVISGSLEAYFSAPGVKNTQYVSGLDESGIDNITADSNATAEYYNLQGVRVANPEAGLYIRRQGNNVTKVYVK